MRRCLNFFIIFAFCSASWATTCTKPTITNVVATPSGLNEILSWTTSVPADSLVGYGPNNGALGPAVSDVATGTLTHSVTVPVLPSVLYGWELRSRAIANGAVCGSAFWGFAGPFQFTAAAAAAGTLNYYVVPEGGHHVVQGHVLYFRVMAGVQVGTGVNNGEILTVSGLPTFTAIRWPAKQDWAQIVCNTLTTTTVANDTCHWYQVQNTEIEIVTNSGGTTPAGTYTLTLAWSGSSSGSATWQLIVDDAAAPYGVNLAANFAAPIGGLAGPTFTAIPQLSIWQNNMTTYGIYWAAEDEDASPRTIRPNDNANLCVVSPGTQKCAWYYDGGRVYYAIADYQGNLSTWNQAIVNFNAVYRDGYIIPNNGNVQPFLFMVDGIYRDYLVTGAAADLTAIDGMAAHAYNAAGGNLVNVRYLQRETEKNLRAAYFENKLGRSQTIYTQPTSYWLQYYEEHLLDHLEQICLGTPDYYEDFMVGLEADIAIQYYNDGHQSDTRIPAVLKCVGDYMITNNFNTISDDTGTFAYDNWRNATNLGMANGGGSSQVLENNLIAPLYSWLHKVTGQAIYETEYHDIFTYGATLVGANGQGGGLPNFLGYGPPGGNGGKDFSQYFFWSPLGVAWDTPPVPTAPIMTVTLSGSSDYGPIAPFSSADKTITLTNTGNAALTISSIAAAGNGNSYYSQTNNCPGSLAVSASCSITATFAPLTLGLYLGQVNIIDTPDTLNSSVALQGGAVAPDLITGTGNLIKGAGSIIK